MEFLAAPDVYYDSLRENLKTAKIKVKEDLNRLQVSGHVISRPEVIHSLSAPVLKHKLCASFEGTENLS